jgi:hypothetical protein
LLYPLLNQILIDDKIKIFPNPSNNNLKIDVSNEIQIQKIELFEIGGKKVKTYYITSNFGGVFVAKRRP